MKKVVLLLTAFFVCLAAPMSYLVMRTYQSIEHEERAEFRFFTESLFDRIEEDLARIVIREESRPVDHYRTDSPTDTDTLGLQQSPLAEPPQEAYVLGYFQNNPDGSLLSRVSYVNNLKQGKEYFYRPDGSVNYVVEYDFGERVANNE